MAAVAIMAIGTAFSINEQRKASKEQKKQNNIKNRIEATKRVRGIKRSIAASRIRRAELQASGFAGGISGSSAVSGAVGSLGSDVSSSIGASNQQFTGQQAIIDSQNKIAGFQSQAQMFSGIANIAGQFDDQAMESVKGFFS